MSRFTVKVTALFVLILFCFAACASSQAIENPYSQKIQLLEDYISKHVESDGIPGLSIAFYKDDFIWSKGFGYADLEHKVPAGKETSYRLASVTKPMTAVAIIKLAEEGKLDLDHEVQEYVPYFPKKKWPVTIRQVLGHLGGISHYRNQKVELHIKEPYDTRASVNIFKDWELRIEPGTRYMYTSYGYNLLGAVIEGASGQTYAQYMTENIWLPLGMVNTRMDIAADIIPNRARGYRRIKGKILNSEFIDISSRFAAGGTQSTVIDVIKFARGLDEGKVLSLESQSRMYDSMKTRDGRLTEYGMGWGTDFLSGFWNVDHGGGQTGTSTFILRFPKEKFAVAVACNQERMNVAGYARLVSAVILGAFHVQAETPSPQDYRKLHMVWHIGLGYHSRFGKAFSDIPQETASGFEYFNNLDVHEKDIAKRIIDGIYEYTGSPLFKVGTYMADCLHKAYGDERLYAYRKGGAISFFSAYIDLYKNDTAIPDTHRFTPEMEIMVAEWKDSWGKTWTEETKAFFLLPYIEMENVVDRIKILFSGESVYPSLNARLNGYAYYLKSKDDLDRGLDVLLMATELYPSDANLFDSVGEFYLAKEDKGNSIRYYRKALEINPNLATAKRALKRLEQK